MPSSPSIPRAISSAATFLPRLDRRFFVFSVGFPLVLCFVIAGPNRNVHDFAGTGLPALTIAVPREPWSITVSPRAAADGSVAVAVGTYYSTVTLLALTDSALTVSRTWLWRAGLERVSAAEDSHQRSLSRAPKIERPTTLAFDLDPGPPAAILECAEVGLWLQEVLGELGLDSYPKTSGQAGLQIRAEKRRIRVESERIRVWHESSPS